MEWQDWQSVAFSERHQLPASSGIYVVVDSENFVWYVGQANNLRDRWLGRGHHRYPQLIRSNKKLQHQIYWTLVQSSLLDEKERLYIDQFQPELNGRKVKTYLPKEPQIHREIKRLLKALNKNSTLFPVVRSVVAGEYIDDLEIHCVVIIINFNDLKILDKSIQKRFSSKVRDAWFSMEDSCGFDESLYRPVNIPIYTFDQYRFEFVAIPDIIRYLSLQNQSDFLKTVSVFGVPVKALMELEFLDELNLDYLFQFPYSDNRKPLKNAAYLNYIRPDLKLLTETSQNFEL